MFSANQLKESISISRPTSVSNGSGGYTTTYTNILTTYAEVKHKSVSNDLIAQGTDLIEVYDFNIRYRQDIKIQKGDRLEWRGRVFEIVGLPPGFINREKIKIVAKTSNTTTDNGI